MTRMNRKKVAIGVIAALGAVASVYGTVASAAGHEKAVSRTGIAASHRSEPFRRSRD